MTTQEQYFALLAELKREQDAYLRGVARSRYDLDDGAGGRVEVTRDEWRTVTTDRCNQLALACQAEGRPAELVVPPGGV
jgi:hypothetical protein